MDSLKRYDKEDENAYIWRICDNKDLIGTWQDVCDLLNKELNHEYNESWYRKMYQSFIKMFDAIKDKYCDEEQISIIEEKKQELIKERCKLNDARTAYNRMLRNDARLENRMDNLEKIISDFAIVNYEITNKSKDIKEYKSDNDLLVILSDLHIGQNFNSFNGIYNTDVAKKRLNDYLNKIIDIKNKNNSENCFISLQGDLISNSIHKSIAITNQENVIEQIKIASEMITGFIYELSKYFNRIEVTSVSGNHSRMDRKEDALKDERLDDLIFWYLKTSLKHIDNVNINISKENTFAEMNIRGKKYVHVHGDYDSFSKNGIASLSMMLGYFPYAITFGHLHTCAMMDEGGVKIIRGGSLAGSGDDYTVEKRLTGKASQMVCVCKDAGIDSYNVIEFE